MLLALYLQYTPDFSGGLQNHHIDRLRLPLGLAHIIDEVRQDTTERAAEVSFVGHGDLRDIPVWPQLSY